MEKEKMTSEFNTLIQRLTIEGEETERIEGVPYPQEKFTRNTRKIVNQLIDILEIDPSLAQKILTELDKYFYNYAPYKELRNRETTAGKYKPRLPEKEAIKYVNAIRNENKKAYAQEYHRWILGGEKGDQPSIPQNLSYKGE